MWIMEREVWSLCHDLGKTERVAKRVGKSENKKMLKKKKLNKII